MFKSVLFFVVSGLIGVLRGMMIDDSLDEITSFNILFGLALWNIYRQIQSIQFIDTISKHKHSYIMQEVTKHHAAADIIRIR